MSIPNFVNKLNNRYGHLNALPSEISFRCENDLILWKLGSSHKFTKRVKLEEII